MKNGNRLGRKKFSLVNVLLSPEVSILIPLLILVAITASQNPKFLNPKNLQIILRYCAYVGFLAIGEAMVVMTGDIDLSIGANSALTGLLFGIALVKWNIGLVGAICVALAAGLIIGGFNAFISYKLNINAWIVTMATQYICIGLSTGLSKGQTLNLSDWGTALKEFANQRPLGLSYIFFIFIAFIVIGELVIRFTPVGRKVHGVGLSVYATRLAGVNVPMVKSLCMIFCGFMAAVTGVMQSINNNASQYNLGFGNEFPAIIAAIIGGVSNLGGKGTPLGILLGVIMYQTLKNCLQMLGANNNVQLLLLGVILVFAVYIDVVKTKLSQRVRKAAQK